MRSDLSAALILIMIVISSTAILSLVNAMTAPVIDENRLRTRLAMANEIFPEADRIDGAEVFREGKIIGYIFEASEYGYSSEIMLLVGMDADGAIRGVRILEQQETPGLGTKITEPWFTDQFVGKDQRVVFGRGIDGVTGATKSSEAVVDAVNEVLER